MQLASGYESRRARIEMVPLMDIIFLQLVYFIYAMMTMSVHRGVRVSLPDAAGAAQPVDSFVITVTGENVIQAQGRPSTMDEAVESALRDAAPARRPVVIYGDRQADLGIAIELLSKLRLSGIEAVSFLVESRNGKQAGTDPGGGRGPEQ